MKIKQFQENEIFGDDDILDKQLKRTSTIICTSIVGEVMKMIKKDFIQLTENQKICNKILDI